MLLKKINILLILSLFCCLKLKAQDSTLMGKTIKWDLVLCIEYAKKNNIQINSFRLSQLTSQQEYLLAKAARLPNLSGSATQDFQPIISESSALLSFVVCAVTGIFFGYYPTQKASRL